jgi:hypothetical protein
MEGAGIVSDSADRHVIKEHVASQRQQASVLATNARDVQDMIFIAHSETVTFCVSPWEAVCVASPCGRLVLQALGALVHPHPSLLIANSVEDGLAATRPSMGAY